ncbi:hypothetical protein SEA_GIBBLES_4 [Gordonia phage Gibbles]|uniref:Uncharacterized protein n=3 Tax=Gordonia phage Orchid TaxID=1838075 RepID=A0A166YGS2_9CAUD|nr:hypothetical protein BH761_gp004 [Gordonia phage Orchid]ANA87238.1 hypothetical protein PBI_PATRICKSTAR_4 [Gordonia phage PatrickStar]ANA87462.1 hypothetical protein PBI_ORCHID_4 [Gordonia phage Orchid]ANA87577.1 hypothetical protein PBI_KAMPE_4 [Gordonia phage Kampe]QDK01963.1 hypothetical protein SEA_GIBBLES_4 [Gordonia phage Gibbles]
MRPELVIFLIVFHIIATLASFVIIYVGLRFLWERHRKDFWAVITIGGMALIGSVAVLVTLIAEN